MSRHHRLAETGSQSTADALTWLATPAQPAYLFANLPVARTKSSFSAMIQSTRFDPELYYQQLELGLSRTDQVTIELALPGLGVLQLALTQQPRVLQVDITGGNVAAQQWLLKHRRQVERRVQRKSGRAVSIAQARGHSRAYP